MRGYHTKIEINRPVAEVWKQLTDFEAYTDWNPIIKTLEGEMKEGNKLKAYIIPLKQKLSVKLLEFQEEKAMAWEGSLISNRLTRVYHYYHLEALEEERTLLKHGETFSGALAWMIPVFVLQKNERLFNLHNQRLKKRLELIK
jgi:hypothetical protein